MADVDDDDADDEDGARVKNHYAPLPGAPNVKVELRHPGRFGTPLFRDSVMGRSMDQEHETTLHEHKIYPGSGRPEANNPTPACLLFLMILGTDYKGVE